MRDLAVLVPSRERPHNVARLLDAMDRTCRGDTTLVLGVDDDDPLLSSYSSFADLEVVVEPNLRRQLVRWLNLLAVPRASAFKYIGHIGDDNVPQTVGWDVRVMESLERNQFCFANDLDPGRPPGALSIHIFMRAAVIRTLGYFAPPTLRHMYPDPVWHAWGTATTMEFLEDVILEHMHYSFGKAPIDESYQHSTSAIPEDCAAYNDYCDDPGGLNADIAKLNGTPFGFDELIAFQRKLNIPHRWGQEIR